MCERSLSYFIFKREAGRLSQAGREGAEIRRFQLGAQMIPTSTPLL